MARIRDTLDAGFKIGIVNYFMDESNVPLFRARREKFAELGSGAPPDPLWGQGGKYKPADLELMEEALPELDFQYRTGLKDPHGKICRYPSISYEMDYRGLSDQAVWGSAPASSTRAFLCRRRSRFPARIIHACASTNILSSRKANGTSPLIPLRSTLICCEGHGRNGARSSFAVYPKVSVFIENSCVLITATTGFQELRRRL